MGCHFLLQGIFLTQGLNPSLLCLLHWQADCFTTEPSPSSFYQIKSGLSSGCLLALLQKQGDAGIAQDVKITLTFKREWLLRMGKECEKKASFPISFNTSLSEKTTELLLLQLRAELVIIYFRRIPHTIKKIIKKPTSIKMWHDMKLNIKLFNAHTVIAPITFKIFICLPKPPRYKRLIIKNDTSEQLYSS